MFQQILESGFNIFCIHQHVTWVCENWPSYNDWVIVSDWHFMSSPTRYSICRYRDCYGSKDKNLGKRGSQSFSYVPNIQIYEIENGSHSCYIDYPDVFNNKVKEFILAQTESCRLKQEQLNSQKDVSLGKTNDIDGQNVMNAQNQTLTWNNNNVI